MKIFCRKRFTATDKPLAGANHYTSTKFFSLISILSLITAAAVLGTGCAAGSSAPEEEEMAAIYITNLDPLAGSEAEGTLPSSDQDPAMTEAASGSATEAEAFPAITPVSSSDESDTAEITFPLGDHEDDGHTSTNTTDPASGEDGQTTEAVTDPGPSPADQEGDGSLREDMLYTALMECTGWGQSTGSSLRAAYAATQFLMWANTAQAGTADTDLLKETVKTQFKRFSSDERALIRSNWSSISYDADMILDDFEEVSYLLEDAGCSEAAGAAANAPNALENWKAAKKALDSVLD